MDTSDDVEWTDEAEQYVEDNVPGFVRSKAVTKIEDAARDRGENTVTLALVKEVGKNVMG